MQLDAALEAIDAANAHDPTTVGGHEIVALGQPLAWIQGRRADAWVLRLEPQPSAALRLAARGHHLRRWTVPRITYPEGRAGYLRWRQDQSERHADEIAALLAPLEIPAGVIERVQAIVTKTALGSDAEVQVFEDAVALAFMETQFHAALCNMERGRDQMVEVIRKTLAKMSEAGRTLAGTLEFSPLHSQIVSDASS